MSRLEDAEPALRETIAGVDAVQRRVRLARSAIREIDPLPRRTVESAPVPEGGDGTLRTVVGWQRRLEFYSTPPDDDPAATRGSPGPEASS